MDTIRNVIESFRQRVRERHADSDMSNQLLYSILVEQARWLIKREVAQGRIYRNNSLFQTLGCVEVIETSTIDECCPVKANCKIYRTKNKLPEAWIDNNGPILRNVTSVDGSTEFFIITPEDWQNKRKNPYQKMSNMKYVFPGEGYLWFPEHNPHRVNVPGYYTEDISEFHGCKESKECVRFLDQPFMLPDWLHAEMMAKALEQVAGVTLRIPEDEQIDKNSNRKN